MRLLLFLIAIVSIPMFFIQMVLPIHPILYQITGWIAGISSIGWLASTLIYIWLTPQYSCYNCGKGFRTIDQQQDHFSKHLCPREIRDSREVKE